MMTAGKCLLELMELFSIFLRSWHLMVLKEITIQFHEEPGIENKTVKSGFSRSNAKENPLLETYLSEPMDEPVRSKMKTVHP